MLKKILESQSKTEKAETQKQVAKMQMEAIDKRLNQLLETDRKGGWSLDQKKEYKQLKQIWQDIMNQQDLNAYDVTSKAYPVLKRKKNK